MNTLVWFKRDLRVHDHPALSRAAQTGAVLPLYIVEPDYWAQPDTSARQWAFIAECLAQLRRDLAALGAPLIIRTGEAVNVLERLKRAHRINAMISHEETGNLWSYERDKRVAAWARGAKVDWCEMPQSNVLRAQKPPQTPRDTFTRAAVLETPKTLRALSGLEPGAIPSAQALRLRDDPCPHRQTGGREQGLMLMESFLTTRGESYRMGMFAPLSAERACSRLSPHLALGTISAREAFHAGALRQNARPGGMWNASLATYQNRLTLRDHFMQKFEERPHIETACLLPSAEGLRPSPPDAVRLAAWSAGETGFPFLDACMRYLRAAGWLNFRARALLVSVASYHLWLDWRASGIILAQRFTDYEPGIHWPQMQIHAGTSSSTGTLRIYNPVKQAYELDPSGTFTRRWLPELAAVPNTFLQEPWKWEGRRGLLGKRYPEPIVDLMSAYHAARSAFSPVRSKAPSPAQSIELIEGYAHKSPERGAKKRAPGGGHQLSFDL